MKKEIGNSDVEEIARAESDSGKRVSGEPDSNLAVVGAGAIAGATAGAAIGTILAGPAGGVIGAAAGTIAGGAVAERIQEKVDPKLEELYWEENFKHSPYCNSVEKYEECLAAFRLGWESASRRDQRGCDFEEIERELANQWYELHGTESDWSHVREIVRDGFDRMRQRRLSHQ